MERLKASLNAPAPRPGEAWLAGVMIGGAIVTMAATAMLLGAGMAIQTTMNGGWQRRL